MNRGLRNGLILAAIHLAIVGSLGVKLLADRARCPRVWVRAAPVDPDLPIRGRYVSIRPQIDRFERMPPPVERQNAPAGRAWPAFGDRHAVKLEVRQDRLWAIAVEADTGVTGRTVRRAGVDVVEIDPVAFFIPESSQDPSIRPGGEELWVEVTIPRRGAPRPIRLGVKKDGALTPLTLR